MLDLKQIRQNPQEIIKALSLRNTDVVLDEVLQQLERRNHLLALCEEKKALRNGLSKEMGMARKRAACPEALQPLADRMRCLTDEIECLNQELSSLDQAMTDFLKTLPNLPHSSVPHSQYENIPLCCCGCQRSFVWEPKTSAELQTDLGLKRGEYWHGQGARLQRALKNFLLDALAEQGFEEMSVLGITAEQSLLSAFQNRILSANELPVQVCTAFPAAEKAELLLISPPEESERLFEAMVNTAANMLERLQLSIRVSALCTGQLAFSAAEERILEVWIPSEHRYRAAVRFSAQDDFLARDISLRMKRSGRDKPCIAHTISALFDFPQLIASILENHQNEDGTIAVPQALIPYLHADQIHPQ